MTPAVFAIPGDIELPTGGYMYDRRVLALLARFGVAARHVQLPGSFPDPSAADLDETGRLLAAAAPGATVMIDGLAYGAMPAEVIAQQISERDRRDPPANRRNRSSSRRAISAGAIARSRAAASSIARGIPSR